MFEPIGKKFERRRKLEIDLGQKNSRRFTETQKGFCLGSDNHSYMEGGGDEGIESRVEDSKDLQQQSKALDKLTDHVEDRQLDSTRVQEVLFSSYICYCCNFI